MPKTNSVIGVVFMICAFASQANAEARLAEAGAKARLSVCLEDYHERLGQARYRAAIEWNDVRPQSYARVDLGAADRGGAVWPQFRDERFARSGSSTEETFTVGDVSTYPLELFLLSFDATQAAEFDADCASGFCFVAGEDAAERTISDPVTVRSPDQTVPCD